MINTPGFEPFSPVSPYRAELGESPVWCPDSASLWWVDCAGRKLINTRLDSSEDIWSTPEIVGFVALAFGKVLVGLETGLFAFDRSAGSFEKVMALEGNNVRFNDAATGCGYLWASTMDAGLEEPIGSVLRVGPDFSALRCLTGYRRANGLAADPVRSALYVSDSHPARASIEVARLDATTYQLTGIAPFGGGPKRPGRPDGAALDASGNYWIARVDAGLIDVMTPGGELLAAIPVPVPEPTKIAFGGPDLRTLFVTSKAKGTLGGRLLSARLDDIWPGSADG